MDNKNKPVIELLEENELKVSQLYRLYSQKIPACKIFWNKLSKEEIEHADYIHGYGRYSKAEFSENKFTLDAINYVVEFVKDEIKKTKSSNISHFDAINTALRIERSILEKKYFAFFNPKNQEMKEMMKKLNKEVKRHIQMLQQEMAKLIS